MKSKLNQIKFVIILIIITSGNYLSAQSKNLVVIDQNFANKEKLLSRLSKDAIILNLNESSNPWKMIREKLQSDTNLKNIHLFTESTSTSLTMGGITYTHAMVEKELELPMLEGLYDGTNLQLLLYTCNLPSTKTGLDLITKIGNMAYLNIAAPTQCSDIFSQLSFDFTTLNQPTVAPILN